MQGSRFRFSRPRGRGCLQAGCQGVSGPKISHAEPRRARRKDVSGRNLSNRKHRQWAKPCVAFSRSFIWTARNSGLHRECFTGNRDPSETDGTSALRIISRSRLRLFPSDGPAWSRLSQHAPPLHCYILHTFVASCESLPAFFSAQAGPGGGVGCEGPEEECCESCYGGGAVGVGLSAAEAAVAVEV